MQNDFKKERGIKSHNYDFRFLHLFILIFYIFLSLLGKSSCEHKQSIFWILAGNEYKHTHTHIYLLSYIALK